MNNHLTLFARYNYSPSDLTLRGAYGDSPNSVARNKFAMQTATAGATWAISPLMGNDLRFNYSRNHSSSAVSMDGFMGAVPLSTLPLPTGYSAQNASFFLDILPLGNGGPQCENDIGITGAHVSRGSETGGQRDCRVVSRIESDLGIGIFDRTQSVSLVELRRQVHVAIDEARKDEFLAKIDKLTARRRIDEAARHHLDPPTFDKNALHRFGLYVWMASLPTAGLPPATWPASAFVGVNPSPHPPPPEGFGASAAAGMTKARCRAMLASLPI